MYIYIKNNFVLCFYICFVPAFVLFVKCLKYLYLVLPMSIMSTQCHLRTTHKVRYETPFLLWTSHGPELSGYLSVYLDMAV